MEWFWIIAIIAGGCAYIYLKYRPRPDMLCLRCHGVGEPRQEIEGSGCIELFLWIAFIIPGILYSLWRSSSRHGTCRSCGSRELVPLDSPRAREILGDNNSPEYQGGGARLARAEDFLPQDQIRRQEEGDDFYSFLEK